MNLRLIHTSTKNWQCLSSVGGQNLCPTSSITNNKLNSQVPKAIKSPKTQGEKYSTEPNTWNDVMFQRLHWMAIGAVQMSKTRLSDQMISTIGKHLTVTGRSSITVTVNNSLKLFRSLAHLFDRISVRIHPSLQSDSLSFRSVGISQCLSFTKLSFPPLICQPISV